MIGLARDGHVVYGPLNSNGQEWSCAQHDVCNGTFLEDGSYAYVSTSEWPYTVSCWGPATDPSSCGVIGPFYHFSFYFMNAVPYLIILALIFLCCLPRQLRQCLSALYPYRHYVLLGSRINPVAPQMSTELSQLTPLQTKSSVERSHPLGK